MDRLDYVKAELQEFSYAVQGEESCFIDCEGDSICPGEDGDIA